MKHNIFEYAKRFDLQEILGEPVCNHLQLQKMCFQLGYRETGLEVDLMPAAAYTKEQSAHGRVSALLGYFLHNPVPRTVFLPPVYRDELKYLYTGMGAERTFAGTKEGLPARGDSQGKIDVFATAATEILRMHGYFIGGLLPSRSGGDSMLMQKVKCETDWGEHCTLF